MNGTWFPAGDLVLNHLLVIYHIISTFYIRLFRHLHIPSHSPLWHTHLIRLFGIQPITFASLACQPSRSGSWYLFLIPLPYMVMAAWIVMPLSAANPATNELEAVAAHHLTAETCSQTLCHGSSLPNMQYLRGLLPPLCSGFSNKRSQGSWNLHITRSWEAQFVCWIAV